MVHVYETMHEYEFNNKRPRALFPDSKPRSPQIATTQQFTGARLTDTSLVRPRKPTPTRPIRHFVHWYYTPSLQHTEQIRLLRSFVRSRCAHTILISLDSLSLCIIYIYTLGTRRRAGLYLPPRGPDNLHSPSTVERDRPPGGRLAYVRGRASFRMPTPYSRTTHTSSLPLSRRRRRRRNGSCHPAVISLSRTRCGSRMMAFAGSGEMLLGFGGFSFFIGFSVNLRRAMAALAERLFGRMCHFFFLLGEWKEWEIMLSTSKELLFELARVLVVFSFCKSLLMAFLMCAGTSDVMLFVVAIWEYTM